MREQIYIILCIGFVGALLVFLVGRALYLRHQRTLTERRLNAMFTSITHELLTPLTIIEASVENLRNAEPSYSNEYDLMELNIVRSVRLLQQILESTKANEGRLRLLVSQGDVMAYIRQTAQSIIPLMTKKGLHFSIECSPQSMMGWIDTDKLDKIIFNLLSNASKYTNGSDGCVSLNVKTNNHFDHVIIEVSDTGCGIPKKKQRDLFQMYYDGDYRSHGTFGTGIGLALTKQLVYLHKGTISYEGDEGKGSRFTIDLPISKDSFRTDQIDEKHKVDINIPTSHISDITALSFSTIEDDGQEVSEEAYRLLLVEDNEELLNLMNHLLRADYKVYTAHNGDEALEVALSTPLDIIISDVMMPGMDGYELTEKIKNGESTKHLPIILLTAKRLESDKTKSLEIGADDYITKPFKMGDLKLRIKNIIENRRRMQNEFRSLSLEATITMADKPDPVHGEFLSKAMDVMRSHLSDVDYDRDSFASDMGMSQSSLYNKLRSATGMNVTSFMRNIRIKEACNLLSQDTNIRISDVAYQVGFRDPKYFATMFKKETGIQPSEFIEQLKSPSKS